MKIKLKKSIYLFVDYFKQSVQANFIFQLFINRAEEKLFTNKMKQSPF